MNPLTVNLEKKLIKENQKLITPRQLLLVNEYERLDSFDANAVLERIGLDNNIRTGKNIKERASRLKKETLQYNQGRVFHISQIETICKKYYLRFLNSQYFKGNLDIDLPVKISTFEATYHKSCNQSNIYIVAPKSSFKLEQEPKDPLLFYKINDDYYYLIHKWGNDMSIFRRFLGLLGSPVFTTLSVVVATIICAIFSVHFWSQGPQASGANMVGIMFTTIGGIIGLIASLIVGIQNISVYRRDNDDKHYEAVYLDGYYWDYKWQR